MISWIEAGLVLVALVLAFTFPHLGSRWFDAAERAMGTLAERPRLAIVVVGLTALATRAALLAILPIPEPKSHDEFSYLLAADTFAHGRLTNPTHPLWIHFETFHELWHPTYASMFPPGQGLFLAFGQVVMGHPFWGVWLSVGLMCAAICWMLQGWLPLKWALLGGLLAVIRLAPFSYWANSYWGGAVAATGGALAFGALPRLKQSLRTLDALLLALGLTILANTRPYEGLIFSLPVVAALLVWTTGKNRPAFGASLRCLFLPAGLVLGVAAVLMGYYFWRVTGSPWRMPHQVYHDAYIAAPYFFGQARRSVPTYDHAVMRNYYLAFELPAWEQSRSLLGVARLENTKITQVWNFFLGPLFASILLIAAAMQPYGFSWRHFNPETRFLLVATGIGVAGCAMEVFFFPHYFAPGTCLIYFLVVSAMRYIRDWTWRQKPVGRAVTRAVPVICAVIVGVSAATFPKVLPSQACPELGNCIENPTLSRGRLLQRLEHEPGQHLVIVRYSPQHWPHSEWVYNAADIDGSKVVWARDMAPEQNAELIKYFHGRRIWLVEPDLTPPRLSPYHDE